MHNDKYIFHIYSLNEQKIQPLYLFTENTFLVRKSQSIGIEEKLYITKY